MYAHKRTRHTRRKSSNNGIIKGEIVYFAQYYENATGGVFSKVDGAKGKICEEKKKVGPL